VGYRKMSGPLDVRLILAIVLLAGALGCSLTRPTAEGTLGDSHLDPSGGSLPAAPARAPTPEPPPEVASHPRHGHPNGQSFPVTLAALGEDVVEDAVYLLTSPWRIDQESALVLGGVAVGIGGLMVFDDDIADFIQRNRTDGTDDASQVLEDVGSAHVVLAGNLALIGTGWWFRETEGGDHLLRSALVSLEAQLFAETLSGMTKIAVGRRRPSEGKGAHSYRPFHKVSYDRSFPSSHASRSFAVATVFADRYDHPVPLIAYSAATAIAVSRVFLDEHFASDVFAGAALGFAIGKALSSRHTNQARGFTVLPYLPHANGGLGLSVQYRY